MSSLMKPPSLLLLAAALLLAGCTSLSTHRNSALDGVKRIYIEHLLTDNHRLDESMVTELRALGYEVSAGPLTMMPEKVDAIITYRARVAWDFKSYVTEFSVELKGTFNGQVIATGSYRQASMITKTPEEVVHLVIQKMMPPR